MDSLPESPSNNGPEHQENRDFKALLVEHERLNEHWRNLAAETDRVLHHVAEHREQAEQHHQRLEELHQKLGQILQRQWEIERALLGM